MTNLYQSAIDNWPEDEAMVVMSAWTDEVREHWSNRDILADIEKDKEHFRKVFSTEDDADELMKRFLEKLEGLIEEKGLKN